MYNLTEKFRSPAWSLTPCFVDFSRWVVLTRTKRWSAYFQTDLGSVANILFCCCFSFVMANEVPYCGFKCQYVWVVLEFVSFLTSNNDAIYVLDNSERTIMKINWLEREGLEELFVVLVKISLPLLCLLQLCCNIQLVVHLFRFLMFFCFFLTRMAMHGSCLSWTFVLTVSTHWLLRQPQCILSLLWQAFADFSDGRKRDMNPKLISMNVCSAEGMSIFKSISELCAGSGCF